jgi:digeranylgeranylglycerophospholipid reductase
MQKKNIAIIGGGPVGCYAAYLLASFGHNVSVYEEHKQIGSPIQCTGLLTNTFDQFLLPKRSFLINTFEKKEVFSIKDSLEIKEEEYLVCRTKFDQFFARLAQEEGAKIFLQHSFSHKEGPELVIKDLSDTNNKNKNENNEKRIVPDIVIAADGPLSKTVKAFGFYEKSRKNYFGIQAVVNGNFDDCQYKTYFGKEICPHLFAWVVPESKTTARVGLADIKGSKSLFDNFIKKHKFLVKKDKIQAGTIPIYNPKQKLFKDNCYALGDAGGHVKATTLGGIIPGMTAAKTLAECINDGKSNQFYLKKMQPLMHELKLHLMIRKVLNKFSDNDWDKLVKLIKQKRIVKTFEKYSRDNPLPLVFFSLLKEPRFLKFVKYIF